MPGVSFGWLNYTILFIYLGAMLAIGWRLAGRQHTTEDFFMAGRNLPWLAVAMSMYASVTSAMTFMGLPGMAYSQNISLIMVSLMSPLVAPVLIFLFYPFYKRLGVTTSYEYIDRRFGTPARFAVAALFILARLGWLGTVIYAPSLALSIVTGLPLWASILMMGLLATVYTVMGGLSAVVWTDVAQFVIMILGAVWVAVTLVTRVPDGAPGILAVARAADHLRIGDWRFDLHQMNSLAVAIAYLFILMQDYGVDQVSVQRLMAVRGRGGQARAIAFNACTDLLVIGLLLFIGLGLFAYYRAFPGELAEGIAGDRTLPYYIIHNLPRGVSGLLITALFAAAMSSMDSGINSISTVIVTDFVGPISRAAGHPRGSVAMARLLTVGLGVFATGIAFAVVRIGGIIKAFYTFMGLFSAPVLALFLLGMLTRRARFAGWAPAAALSIALTLAAQNRDWMHEIYLFPFAFLISFLAGYLLSLRTIAPARNITDLTVWTRAPHP